jgi:hypothetical protein
MGTGDRSNLPERPDPPTMPRIVPVGDRCLAQIGPIPISGANISLPEGLRPARIAQRTISADNRLKDYNSMFIYYKW